MTDETKRIREEFCNPKFRKSLKTLLPQRCTYCGATENLEYHHLIPVELGGDNRLSNLIPLCRKHHMVITHGGTVAQYKDSTNGGGRPRKMSYEEAKPIIDAYARGEFGTAELKERLHLVGRTKVHDSATYKQYLAEHGIKHIKSHVDMLTCRGNDVKPESLLVTVEYKNGDTKLVFDGRTEMVRGKVAS